MKPRLKTWRAAAVLLVCAALSIPGARAMQPISNHAAYLPEGDDADKGPEPSGVFDYRDLNFGNGLTECPQAGLAKDQPKPLDQRDRDQVERISATGNDRRANQDYSCFPQNETSIAVNPRDLRNVVGGANDYRQGFGGSGFYASTDNGNHWYDGILPIASLQSGEIFDGGGDPAVVFDRAGVAYYASLGFNRTNDTNGVFVNRSTNGGFTWSRPCVAFGSAAPATDQNAVCGGVGDPRQPGDGVVNFYQDSDAALNSSVPTNDKEYIAAGPRPNGTTPTCFTPITRTPLACNAAVIGVDRLYVTWTIFSPAGQNFATIDVSYSDDQGRSWSPPRVISGAAPFCTGRATGGRACDDNQGSVPTVSPATGVLYVGFENFNTPAENQYLVVRSRDGGNTFEGPFFVSPIFDVNYPRAGTTRPDCTARGQQPGRRVLTNSCFRVNAYGNIVVDKRGGAFADDLYVVFDDNRNGTSASSNVDVFLFKSTDGGSTWVGPTRVNNDRSQLTVSRSCTLPQTTPRPTDDPRCLGDFGNDQWFPWVDISQKGDVNVVFHDRRLDTSSVASEWPSSRQRPGNYLTWFWGAQCQVSTADSRECVAPEAAVAPNPTAPFRPGPGVQLGQSQASFPFDNFTISDVPSNMDYSFRAGLFMGDYNNVTVERSAGKGNEDGNGDAGRAYAMWTDARNGRSSRTEAGRNPACEQADVFVDSYAARDGGGADKAKGSDSLFLVAPCPAQAVDKSDRGHGNGNGQGNSGNNGRGHAKQ